MTTDTPIAKSKLTRLLEVGYVLEGIVEARSGWHTDAQLEGRPEEQAVEQLLRDAREESMKHRQQLQTLLASLGSNAVRPETISKLVETNYEHGNFNGLEDVLRDQLYSELSAYRFYDNVLELLGVNDAPSPNGEMISVLKDIRAEEYEGVFETLAVMASLEVTSKPDATIEDGSIPIPSNLQSKAEYEGLHSVLSDGTNGFN